MRHLLRLSAIGWSLASGAQPLIAQSPLFSPAPAVAVPRGSGTILIADINGDRHPDMLTRHLEPQIIALFLGDGRGGLTPAPTPVIRLSYAPSDMRLGDLDGDGRLDLAVTESRRDVVDIMTGDARGGFARAAGFPLTVTAATDSFNKRTLQLVDLDGDGDLDVVTANGRRLNTFSTLIGDGRGRFRSGPVVHLDSARDGYSFAFADIDGDRHLDVVAATRTSFAERSAGRIVILRGNGRGIFSRAGVPMPTPPGPAQVALEDMDGDSRPEILLTHADGSVTIWANWGRGRFSAPSVAHRFSGPAYSLIVADFDRDGRRDIAAATVTTVSVLLARGGRFIPAPGSPYPAGPGAYYLTAADLDADGAPDLLSSSFEGDSVRILRGR